MTMAKNLSKRYNEIDRIKMIKAMEFICRQINDEDVLDRWMELGVADGTSLMVSYLCIIMMIERSSLFT